LDRANHDKIKLSNGTGLAANKRIPLPGCGVKLSALKIYIMPEQKFQLVVDGVPYEIKVIPFQFNAETRFRVTYKQDHEHIFAWDPGIQRMSAIDDESSTIPDSLEEAISAKLIVFA